MDKINSRKKYKISVLPGLEGRLVEISDNIMLKYNYNQEEGHFNGKLFIVSQFPLLEDNWEFTKIVKNMLDDYMTSLEGNGWYISDVHIESIESFNNIKENKLKTELLNIFMENDNLDIMYKYLVKIKFKHENIFVLQKENKILQQEIEKLKNKIDIRDLDSDSDELSKLTNAEFEYINSLIQAEKVKRQHNKE